MKRRSLLALTAGFCGLAAVTAMVAARPSADLAVTPAAGGALGACPDAGTSFTTGAGYRAAVGAAPRAVTFDGRRLLLATEYATGDRPAELVGGVAASADGATIATVVDAKGPDRLLLSTDTGASWTTLTEGDDLAYPAVSPSGTALAWTADGALTLATAADGWKPMAAAPTGVTGRTHAQYPRFTDDGRLVLTLDVPVAGVPEDMAGLADVWRYDLALAAWTRLTAGTADADRWSVATTPLELADGSVLYVLMTGLGSGSDADLRTRLHKVTPDGTDKAVTDLPHRWGIVAAAADGSVLFNGPDERSRWQLVHATTAGERSVLGCGRAAWAPPLNHDPDRE